MTGTRRVGIRVLFAAVVIAAAACVPPVFGDIANGSPGADGPCGSTKRTMWNPHDMTSALVLYEPTGSGNPYSGGTCDDDDRPLVLIAHGYGGSAAEVYQGLIDHLVGSGFVVIFQGYALAFDPAHQYFVVDTGFVQGVAASDRIDTSRIGVVGHSYGGGMTSWLLQHAVARGWGGSALWAVMFAPWYAEQVGSGPIDLPQYARVAVVSYEEDLFVDNRIAIDIYRALAIPADHKTHITLLSDRTHSPPVIADHLGPLSMSIPLFGTLSTDHYDRWSAWRTVDAVAGCSLAGLWCNTDFSDVGSRPDGTPLKRALVTDHPVDRGPPALQECEFFLNQRRCPTDV